MVKLIKWFKDLLFVVENFKRETEKRNEDFRYLLKQIHKAKEEIHKAREEIRNRTSLNADINFSNYAMSQVITIGRYNGIDYIEIFDIQDKDLKVIIQLLKQMQKYGKVNRIDAPPGMASFIRDELKYG